MAQQVTDGHKIDITTTGAKTNGQLTKIGSMVGVALTSGASGARVSHALRGVFSVAKKAAAGTSFAQGAKVYSMVTGTVVKATGALATGELLIGTAWAAATTGATTCQVKLHGFAGTIG